MAPTLEDFNKILSSLTPKIGPYKRIGYTPTPKEVARALNLYISNLKANMKTRGNFKGFSRDYLETKAKNFTTAKKWDSLDIIMDLLIFGLV